MVIVGASGGEQARSSAKGVRQYGWDRRVVAWIRSYWE